jgi:ankyrin repeat protein
MVDACLDGCFELAKRFHSNGVPLDIITEKSNASLLYYTVQAGNEKFSLWLIDKKAPAHVPTVPHGYTPLHLACLKGRYKIAAALARDKVSLNIGNSNGDTPLHLACSDNPAKTREEAARLAFYFLSRGADPLAENKQGERAHVFMNQKNLAKGYTSFEVVKPTSFCG